MPSHQLVALLWIVALVRCAGCDVTNMTSLYCVGECLNDPSPSQFFCVDSGCTQIPLDSIDPTVEEVSLSYNSITLVPKLSFTSLVSLDLSYNKIVNISKKAFEQCNELTHLNLSNNLLEVLSKDTWSSRSLTDIDLSGNRIVSFMENIFFWTYQVNVLNLSGNQIEKFESNSWIGLNHLQSLDLSKNRLSSLSHNSLSSLSSLLSLDLSHNKLTSFKSDDVLDGIPTLQALYLDHNKFTKITQDTFNPSTNLKYLFLDNNPISEIDPDYAFEGGWILTTVSLRMNKYLRIIKDGTFSGLSHLESVDVSGSYHLSHIEKSAFDGNKSRLTSFIADNAGLTTLSPDLLNWTRLSTMGMSGNPWNCDCHLAWMKNLNASVTDNVKCHLPFHLKGRNLTNVDQSQLTCTMFSEHRHQAAVGLICFVTAFFVMTSAYLLYTYRRRVFRPCLKEEVKGDYQTLYNAVDEGDREAEVSIQWENGETETSALKKGDNLPAPTAV